MSKSILFASSLLGLSALWSPASAEAILFDFNSLSDNRSNGTVQTYMNNVLHSVFPLASVTLTGAVSDNNYTADNHLVGPKSSGVVTPLALWNTDGSTSGNSDTSKWHLGTRDTYIMNVAGITTISMTFSGIDIVGVSFDLQIFPDGTCPNPTSSSSSVNKGCTSTSNINWPDFKFEADNTQLVAWDGVVPNTGGTYRYSPAQSTWTSGGEKAPQLLTTSGYIDLSGMDVDILDFVDWPAHIGIDNLIVYTTDVPEPATLVIFGSGVVVAWGVRRRRAQAKKPASV